MTTTADKMFEEWVEQYPIQIAGDDYEMCKDAWKAAIAASAQQVEQVEQKPVAWRWPYKFRDIGETGAYEYHSHDFAVLAHLPRGEPLYLHPATSQQVEGEAVAWQYRWLNPDNAKAHEDELRWKTVEPRGMSDIEDRIHELRAYRYNGKPVYEVRGLYTHPTPPTSAAVPEGYKLLKDSTHAERAWIEDAGHENDLYSNTCIECGREFAGHKRRVICRVCAAAPTQPAPTEGEQG